jgi:hypothetical protein
MDERRTVWKPKSSARHVASCCVVQFRMSSASGMPYAVSVADRLGRLGKVWVGVFGEVLGGRCVVDE